MKRNSLGNQISIVFIILICGTVFICWFANAFLLQRLYLKQKQSALREVRDVILEGFENGEIGSADFETEVRRLCSIKNISFIVTDSSSNTLYTSINDEEQFNILLRDIIFSRNTEPIRIICEDEDACFGIMRDPATQTEFLSMWGSLDNDSFFMLRTAVDSIRESVRLANELLLFVGFLAIMLAGILTTVVSSKITKPIKELTEISQQMAELNFEKKYRPRWNNEITVLGENINRLSERLEETISNLKTANLELRKDVAAREQADERRSEFLANVSHELKTPIALIQGYAEGLKEGIIDDPESRNDYCDVIMDETHKMNHLVKRLISLNQVESGTDTMLMERFDISDLITNSLQSCAVMTEGTGIRVEYEAQRNMFVWADEYQVEEVLRNYITNAIHHCRGEEKLIRVTTEYAQGHIRISVFNTGDPIPEDSIEKIWEKFYKVDKSRTREYGGSGLGLSIVKAIMESLQQAYGVRNEENGVTFWFELETK